MTTHTLILIQKRNNEPETRTYLEFETITLALEGVIKLYENTLQELNPNVRDISYDVKDLHKFIDQLGDLVALTFDAKKFAYSPHDREWIKQQILRHLKQAAGLY